MFEDCSGLAVAVFVGSILVHHYDRLKSGIFALFLSVTELTVLIEGVRWSKVLLSSAFNWKMIRNRTLGDCTGLRTIALLQVL
jgi:hypothetical protein